MKAGSAIGQKAGKIDQIDKWFLSKRPRKWLLLCGATEPPSNVTISKRRDDRVPGAYLHSTKDLHNMETAVGTEVFNSVRDLKIERQSALKAIEELAIECKNNDYQPVLYYSGHGELGTGNWCFFDGTIGIGDIISIFQITRLPLVISDACYSGAWANFCCAFNYQNWSDIQCLSACREFQTAFDIPGEGGELTIYLTSNSTFRNNKRPRTEMLYSQKTEQEFPPSEKYSMVDLECIISYFRVFTDSHLRSAFLLNKDHLCVVFEDLESLGEQFMTSESFNDFRAKVDQLWQEEKIINALTKCESRSFFLMQTIKKPGLTQCLISLKRAKDFQLSPKSRIEACFYYQSRFWVLITNYQTDQRKQFLSFRDISDKNFVLKPNEFITCMCLAPKLLDGYKMLLVTEQEETITYGTQIKVEVHNMFLFVLLKHGVKVQSYRSEYHTPEEIKRIPKPKGTEIFKLYLKS